MSNENRIPVPEAIQAHEVYKSVIAEIVALGNSVAELGDELNKANPSKDLIANLTGKIDQKIGMLRADIVKIQRHRDLDPWLITANMITENRLIVIIELFDLAMDANPRQLRRKYPALMVKANFALTDLYYLWGIPLPEAGFSSSPLSFV